MASTRSTVINRHVQTQHQHLLDAIHPLEDRAAFFPHTIVETLSVHIIFALQLLSLTATRGTSSVLSLLAPWRQSFFQWECDAFGRHHRRTCVFFRRGHRSTFPRESCHQEHSIALPLSLKAPAGPKSDVYKRTCNEPRLQLSRRRVGKTTTKLKFRHRMRTERVTSVRSLLRDASSGRASSGRVPP